MAVNCKVWATCNEGAAGVTEIDDSVTGAGWTVRAVDPVTEPRVAEIVLVPAATPKARPPALMLAVELFDDAQVTWLVTSPDVSFE